MTEEHVQVAIRFRPRNEKEAKEEAALPKGTWDWQVQDDNGLVTVLNGKRSEFHFDHVFKTDTTQAEIYATTARRCMESALEGYNSTVFAYGQTGSGKTFTMFGDRTNDTMKGAIPRACDHLFDALAKSDASSNSVKCSFLELYKEKIHDLLQPGHDNLRIRETTDRGVFVDGAHDAFCQTKADVLDTIEGGELYRTVASTNMNATSSRSHSLLILQIEQTFVDKVNKSKMIFIDLAGSERVQKTGAEGIRLDEAKMINKSLMCLARVIKAISANQSFVPYRDSTLTRLLEESLRGNTKTTLFIACSPSSYNADETMSSLGFGQRVKTIKTKVKANQQRSVEYLSTLLAQLTQEVRLEKDYTVELQRQIAYMESAQYDRSKPIPAQFFAKRPEKGAALAAAKKKTTITAEEEFTVTPELTVDETVEVAQAKLELEKIEKDRELDVEQLKYETKELEESIRELKEKSELHSGHLEQLKKELADKNAQLAKLTQRNADQKSKSATARKHTAEKLTEQQEKLRKLTEENAVLQEKVAMADADRSAKLAENDNLREEAATVNRTAATHLHDVKAAEQEQLLLVQKVKNAQITLNACEAEKKALKQQLSDLRKQQKAQQQHITEAKDNLAKRQTELNALREKILQVHQEGTMLGEAHRQLKPQLEALRESGRAQIKSLYDTVGATKQQIESFLATEICAVGQVKACAQIAQEMDKLKQEIDLRKKTEALAALQQQVTDQDVLCQGLETELRRRESMVEEMQRKSQEAISAATEVKAQADSLHKQVATRSIEKEQLAQKLALQSKTLESMKSKDALRENLVTLNEENRVMQERVVEITKTLEDHKKAISALTTKITSVEEEVKSAQDANTSRHQQYQEETRKITVAKSVIDANLKTLRECKQILQAEKEKSRELHKKHTALSADKRELTELTTSLKSEVDELVAKRSHVQQNVVASSVLADKSETGRRVWTRPTSSGGMMDAFRDKVDLSAAARSLRSTLYGSVVLEAARREDHRGEEFLPPAQVLKHKPSPFEIGNMSGVKVNQQKLTSVEVRQYEELFAAADKDGNGAVDADELVDLMFKLGKQISKQEVMDLMMIVDEDGNGTIEFKEFLRGMDRINMLFATAEPVQDDKPK
eukprot:TRINITY_DN4481_c0_g1_i1.p1 TRINITY_DN4481_c0_g1~~TRINITY_DN4481_c0_g1_i1.p1  ORF type:complete len:1136 (+),score=393.11 TRINITY_DN4481_c0_g1_i1:23-3409(+)